MVKTVVSSPNEIHYNIKLVKDKPWKKVLSLSTSLFGGLIIGAFGIYSFKKLT